MVQGYLSEPTMEMIRKGSHPFMPSPERGIRRRLDKLLRSKEKSYSHLVEVLIWRYMTAYLAFTANHHHASSNGMKKL